MGHRVQHRRRHRGLGYCGVLALALSVGSLVAALPAGATSQSRISVPKFGFSLILPDGWSQISLKSSNIGTVIGSSKSYGNLKQLLTTQATEAASKGLKFFAVSAPGAAGSFVPNINVGLFKSSSSLSALKGEVKATWARAGAKNLTTKIVRLAPGSAVEGTYELVGHSTTPTVWETQVYTPHKGEVYIATFSAGTQLAVELNAASVMKTFHFTS
jgi:hypothetical protein